MRLCIIFHLLLTCLPACSETTQIQVDEDKELNSKSYLLTQGACHILWRLQFFPSGKGFGIREEVRCALALQEQIPLRRALLQKVSNETRQLQGMRNFVWASVPNKASFMPRLAKALDASMSWDATTGTPYGKAAKDIHFLRDLMNQKQVFSEVTASFDAEGWQLNVVDVEKVQTGVPTDGYNNTGKYPLDCAIVFSVKRKP